MLHNETLIFMGVRNKEAYSVFGSSFSLTLEAASVILFPSLLTAFHRLADGCYFSMWCKADDAILVSASALASEAAQENWKKK